VTESSFFQSRLEALGDRVLGIFDSMGAFALLSGAAVRVIGRRGFPMREILIQFEAIAVRSSTIVVITALFTGMVLALQTVVSLGRFGAKPYTGSFVGLAFVLELGPVLTALMVSGRVGAGISAELGSMAVTEQVDAIRAMGADPVQKLVLPRVVATTLGLPLLTVFANVLGIFGGLLIATQYGISTNFYYQSVVSVVTVGDFMQSIAKATCFGWIIGMVGCYLGLRTTGGTVGVGRSTTLAVVVASISVLVSDFFLTKFLMMF
jgi:phospholipid/cholesterol/gamma-HCH transport system permease protein